VRIGIFGGTFDPPHLGHLIVAEHVRVEFGLDQIRFTPAWVPPHKQGVVLSGAEHRLAMLHLALEGNPGFLLDEREVKRQGISYTVDTLRALKEEDSRSELFLLIGADNLEEFHKWREPDQIVRLAKLLVMRRPGYKAEGADVFPKGSYLESNAPLLSISSTTIRNRTGIGRSIRYLVPPAVEEYIHAKKLYSRTS
jgi:nicotinate-nucleotide adenylyltransferase